MIEKQARYRRRDKTAFCPFCETRIPKPRLHFPMHLTFSEGGECDCGSIYLYDPTGKNLGQLLADALLISEERTGSDSADADAFETVSYLYNRKLHTIKERTRNIVKVRGAKIFFFNMK